MEKFKESLKENWKGALVGAVASALVVLFGVDSDTAFSGGEMVVDEDMRAQICEGYEPAEDNDE